MRKNISDSASYKVFTEIGPLGFTEFGSASKRTDTSK